MNRLQVSCERLFLERMSLWSSAITSAPRTAWPSTTVLRKSISQTPHLTRLSAASMMAVDALWVPLYLCIIFYVCSWERKSSWAWFLENTHYWHLVHLEFLCKMNECKLYLWLGGSKERASASFRFGGVRWLYLLDRLGAQSCAQS